MFDIFVELSGIVGCCVKLGAIVRLSKSTLKI